MTTNDMTLEALPSMETLLPETIRSLYRFTVIDAPNCRGKLSDGIFGDRPATASFLRIISAREADRAGDFGKAGARAILIYQSNGGFHHFVTSPIIKLKYANQALAE